MADRTPIHPAVRFERTDITAGSIVKFGVYLAAGVALVVVSMLWYGRVLQAGHRKPDALALPRASSDGDRLPPQPRAEAMEDLDEGKSRMFPPRAAEYYAPQRELLEAGGGNSTPIQSAMEAVTKSLPARKAKAEPGGFSIRLPSKASSGHTETGGR